jgi:hypothetical protein
MILASADELGITTIGSMVQPIRDSRSMVNNISSRLPFRQLSLPLLDAPDRCQRQAAFFAPSFDYILGLRQTVTNISEYLLTELSGGHFA